MNAFISGTHIPNTKEQKKDGRPPKKSVFMFFKKVPNNYSCALQNAHIFFLSPFLPSLPFHPLLSFLPSSPCL